MYVDTHDLVKRQTSTELNVSFLLSVFKKPKPCNYGQVCSCQCVAPLSFEWSANGPSRCSSVTTGFGHTDLGV